MKFGKQLFAICTMAVAHFAAAADFPVKPIRLVVPFAPGGSADLVARIIAADASGRLGQPIVVDNTTLVPVSKVSVGFGLGANTGKSELSGSAGGLNVEPIAFIVISDGNARILSLTREKDVFGKAVDLVHGQMRGARRTRRWRVSPPAKAASSSPRR